MDDPVDLKREHHWFSYKHGWEEGYNAGYEGEKSDFREGYFFYPGKVPTNEGFPHTDVVPNAYQQGYEEGYEKGLVYRQQQARGQSP